jgi:hypothetical protein
MSTPVIALLLLGFTLALLLGLWSMLRNLPELYSQGEPLFDEPGLREEDRDRQPKSQFVWQSREHSREPD